MRVRVLVLSICLMGAMASVLAQQPSGPQRAAAPRPATPAAEQAAPGTPAPAAAPAPPAPRRQGQPVNVKVDVTITDQRAGTAALKKTVTVVTGDGGNGFIRSTANYTNLGDVPLNVDIAPELIADGTVRVGVSLQYDLPGSITGQATETPGAGALRRTQIRESLSVILESGKSVTVAQSADPVGDRQVTIDVKATILR
jgi:hypothetical protein